MEKVNLKNLKLKAEEEIKKISSLKELDDLYRFYLGRKGELNKIFDSLKILPLIQRKKIAADANDFKNNLNKLFKEYKDLIKKEVEKTVFKMERIDVSRPGREVKIGHWHPIIKIQREIEGIFESLGFEVVFGPEIETEYYNFTALNVGPDHPARDMQSSFWIDEKKGLLLRTQTSPLQIRYMEKNFPPFRMIAPGRVFRYEATDATHDIQFYQAEGLMIDKDISVANFKSVIHDFFRRLFHPKIEIRLVPSYFPFVEPGFEIYIRDKNGKWLEVMGAGMVHSDVLKRVGINSGEWQGFAFGLGPDRLAMIKYGINDIRLFHSSDLRFLHQF
ncbi:MAG: phenylalanine--tRNA ligase subunit alpha [Parcubacteria group bacterium]|nr:phenylalanine--tRNA ligase subunit alpha [Parcubacteria group bacterium]